MPATSTLSVTQSTTTASIALSLVGTGWMGQLISMRGAIDMQKTLDSAEEANAFADDIRAQLLDKGEVAAVPGRNYRAYFGDFQTVMDVRMVYSTDTFEPYATGLFGSCERNTTTREEIADFRNEDSYRCFINDEED